MWKKGGKGKLQGRGTLGSCLEGFIYLFFNPYPGICSLILEREEVGDVDVSKKYPVGSKMSLGHLS